MSKVNSTSSGDSLITVWIFYYYYESFNLTKLNMEIMNGSNNTVNSIFIIMNGIVYMNNYELRKDTTEVSIQLKNSIIINIRNDIY